MFKWIGPAKEVKGGGGSATQKWKVIVARKSGFNPLNTVEVKGRLEVDVIFDPTDPRGVLAHEMTHVDKWKEHWDYLKSEIDWLERDWCKPCDKLAIDFGNASSNYWEAQGDLQQAIFDVAEYSAWNSGVSRVRLLAKIRDKDAKTTARDKEKVKYDKAKSKFNSSGCFKK